MVTGGDLDAAADTAHQFALIVGSRGRELDELLDLP
jgi:hypothetical protein